MMAPTGLREFEDLPGLAMDPHMPAVRFVGHIPILGPNPQRSATECDRRHLAQMIPLSQVLSVQIETLQAGVVTICYVDDPLIVYRNPVRLVELSRTGSRTAPLPDAFAFAVVFENAGVAVAVRD